MTKSTKKLAQMVVGRSYLADSLALHVVTLPPDKWLDVATAMVASYRGLLDRDFPQLPAAARAQSATNFANALLTRIATMADETGGAAGNA